MANLLQQLENNEAVLLMYLAGELPPEDHAEVEQLLSTDANLRAELEQIEQMVGASVSSLDRLDAVEGAPSRQGAVIRNASRLVRQWQVNRVVAPQSARPEASASHGWMRYAAVAAAIAIITGAWLANRSRTIPSPMSTPSEVELVQSFGIDAVTVGMDVDAIDDDAIADRLEDSFDNSHEILAAAAENTPLDEVERQLLAAGSDTGTQTIPSLLPFNMTP